VTKKRKSYGGMKGTLHGIDFESGHEKKFIRICRQLGIRLTRCEMKIPYCAEGRWHTYSPDFSWPAVNYVIEVKGSWAFKDNHGFVREKYTYAMKELKGRYALISEKELTSEFVMGMYKAILSGRTHGIGVE
jgi:Phage endonuclease I